MGISRKRDRLREEPRVALRFVAELANKVVTLQARDPLGPFFAHEGPKPEYNVLNDRAGGEASELEECSDKKDGWPAALGRRGNSPGKGHPGMALDDHAGRLIGMGRLVSLQNGQLTEVKAGGYPYPRLQGTATPGPASKDAGLHLFSA